MAGKHRRVWKQYSLLGATQQPTASISLLDVEGKRVTPGVWDLSIGAGYSVTGFKTLHQRAEQIRKHVR